MNPLIEKTDELLAIQEELMDTLEALHESLVEWRNSLAEGIRDNKEELKSLEGVFHE